MSSYQPTAILSINKNEVFCNKATRPENFTRRRDSYFSGEGCRAAFVLTSYLLMYSTFILLCYTVFLMPENAITDALLKIIKSQRMVNAIAHSLREQVEEVLDSGNIAEAFTLKNELVRILRIMDQLETHFNALDTVRASRMNRAAMQRERQQVIN